MLWSTLVYIMHGITLDYNNSLMVFLIKKSQVASMESQYRKVNSKSEKEKKKIKFDWGCLESSSKPRRAIYQEKTKQDTENRVRTGV